MKHHVRLSIHPLSEKGTSGRLVVGLIFPILAQKKSSQHKVHLSSIQYEAALGLIFVYFK